MSDEAGNVKSISTGVKGGFYYTLLLIMDLKYEHAFSYRDPLLDGEQEVKEIAYQQMSLEEKLESDWAAKLWDLSKGMREAEPKFLELRP